MKMIQSLEYEMMTEQHRITRICNNHERYIGSNLEDLRDFFIEVIMNGWKFKDEAKNKFFIDGEEISKEQLKEIWKLAEDEAKKNG